MTATHTDLRPAFAQRCDAVRRQARAADGRGVARHLGAEGLVAVRARRASFDFPWQALSLLVGAMLVAKAVTLMQMGTDAYAANLGALAHGGMVEKLGALVLHADWLSVALSDGLRTLLG